MTAPFVGSVGAFCVTAEAKDQVVISFGTGDSSPPPMELSADNAMMLSQAMALMEGACSRCEGAIHIEGVKVHLSPGQSLNRFWLDALTDGCDEQLVRPGGELSREVVAGLIHDAWTHILQAGIAAKLRW